MNSFKLSRVQQCVFSSTFDPQGVGGVERRGGGGSGVIICKSATEVRKIPLCVKMAIFESFANIKVDS